jgi:hypothetical protein
MSSQQHPRCLHSTRREICTGSTPLRRSRASRFPQRLRPGRSCRQDLHRRASLWFITHRVWLVGNRTAWSGLIAHPHRGARHDRQRRSALPGSASPLFSLMPDQDSSSRVARCDAMAEREQGTKVARNRRSNGVRRVDEAQDAWERGMTRRPARYPTRNGARVQPTLSVECLSRFSAVSLRTQWLNGALSVHPVRPGTHERGCATIALM